MTTISSEETLGHKILMMIAGNLDRWQPDDDSETGMEVVRCAQLTAQGIARKLSLALAAEIEAIIPERWQQMVQDACQDAFIEVTSGGPLVKIGENPNFVRAVAACTARVVAPQGSAWLRAIEAQEETALRAQLRKYKLPRREIERLIAEMRARRE